MSVTQGENRMVYVMSDDYYFSLGIQAVYAETGRDIGIIPCTCEDDLRRTGRLSDTDTLLLAIENMDVLHRVLVLLSARKTRVALFLKMVRGCEEYTRLNGVIRRQIAPSALFRDVTRSVRFNRVRKAVTGLTFPQRFVLERLVRGRSHLSIAGELRVSGKSVYGYKNAGLARLGLSGRMNCRNLLIYSCLARLG
ncbi:hypothetical protein [Enterobacter bugandensis]|uniref:hypothetical protein n=1 Tax=Enterobacter bugandensis TaxID=881260 RepID=UPI00200684E0|nr:hypothetical protein [Enterobacter bugandensis]MCK6964513.1 hypothetical protein [Enterobacter bugandensis]